MSFSRFSRNASGLFLASLRRFCGHKSDIKLELLAYIHHLD